MGIGGTLLGVNWVALTVASTRASFQKMPLHARDFAELRWSSIPSKRGWWGGGGGGKNASRCFMPQELESLIFWTGLRVNLTPFLPCIIFADNAGNSFSFLQESAWRETGTTQQKAPFPAASATPVSLTSSTVEPSPHVST